jgi:carboxypeptidase Q
MVRTPMRQWWTAGVVVAALSAAVVAQETVDRDAIAKMRSEAMDRSQVERLLDMFANVIGPRLTGSPAYKRSADWSRETLVSWGIDNARLDPWEFGRGWTLDRLTLEMVEPRYMPLLGFPDGWSPPTRGEIVAPVVYVGGKTPEQIEAMKDRLKGAIVLAQPLVTQFIDRDRPHPEDGGPTSAPPPGPGAAAGGQRGNTTGQRANTPGQRGNAAGQRGGNTGGQRGGGAAQQLDRLYHDAGVAAVVRPSRGMHGTVFVTGRDNPDNSIPRITLAAEHYNTLVRLAEREQPVKLRVNVQARFLTDDRNSYNVLAEIPGTDPALRSEIVMIGGHLDSWHTATGATDNADGAAVILEAMRIIKASGVRPRRTIRMALWGGEEEGLLGSRQYVEKYLAGDANRAERERFSAYFNIDPGYGPIYGFFLQNNDAARPIFDAWLAPFKDLGVKGNVRQEIGSTDHLSFTRIGLPGFNPIQSYADYDIRTHHTNVDTVERMKAADLKQAALIMASFAYHASVRPEKLPRPAPVQ